MGMVAFLEGGDGDAHLLDISEDAAVDRLLLQRPVEALGHPVGLGLGDEREAWRDALKLDLVEEIVGGVLRTVVHMRSVSLRPASTPVAPNSLCRPWEIGCKAAKRLPILTAWMPTQQASQ